MDPSSERRIPAWVWGVLALAAPALLIGLASLASGGARVAVVGAGTPLSALRAEDAPEGLRYGLAVEASEAPAATALRVEDELTTWPDVLVIGLDAGAVESEEGRAAYRGTLARLVRQAESALAVPVVVAPDAPPGASDALRRAVDEERAWWRLELCRERGSRVCVDVPSGTPPGPAIAAGVREALARHEQWRASTQVGR